MNSVEPAHCMFKCEESIEEKETTNEEGETISEKKYKDWNVQYLSDNFPKNFIWGQGTNAKGAGPKTKKSYRQHREEVMLDQQLALMAATQPIVEKEQKLKQIRTDKSVILKRIKACEKKLYSRWSYINYVEGETAQGRNKRVDKLREEHQELLTKRARLIREMRRLKNENQEKNEEPKIINRGHCPKCPGFISEGWMCGLCQTKVCSKCREEITEDQLKAHQETLKMRKKGQKWVARTGHICNKDTLESIKHLKESNYRNCPSCKVYIERSYGCFAKDTPVLLYDGTTKFSQNVQIGDQLIGDDGKMRTVLDTCNGKDKLYEITQNNGESYIVNSNHKIVLKYRYNGCIKWSKQTNRWILHWFCREEKC